MKAIKKNSLTPEQVVDILITKLEPVGCGCLDIHEAVGYICSENLEAPIDVPHFNRSRVDGYVVSEQDLMLKSPMVLQKTRIVPAGSAEKNNIVPGTTIKIMTGAPVPLGAGAVIKQEEVEEYPHEIKINGIPIYNTNIELTGSIIKKGQVLAYKGQRYTPQLIEYIAATGINKVPIYKKPAVYIINSGSELELPGSVLEYGKIFNSNQSMFMSLLSLAGCDGIAGCGQLTDDLDLICDEIRKGLDSGDLIIVSGGNSEGDYDLIPQALIKIGANIIVNHIEMKPGHRTVVASYDNKLIFNVPGNPHAGYIIFQVLIKPVLKKICGDLNPLNHWFKVKLLNNINRTNNSRTFYRGALVSKDEGVGAIVLSPYQFDYGLAPMILDIAPNQGREGDLVRGMLII